MIGLVYIVAGAVGVLAVVRPALIGAALVLAFVAALVLAALSTLIPKG